MKLVVVLVVAVVDDLDQELLNVQPRLAKRF